jgi:hypothetical protein
MIEQVVALILDENKWLTIAILLSIVAVTVLVCRRYRQSLPERMKILEAMNMFGGWLIGIMSFGHLLAVTVKASQGDLRGSLPILYPLGLVLAIPSWWIVFRVGRYMRQEERFKKRLLSLNVWLAVSLLALGLHNWPLAMPAVLNIAYQLNARRAVGWAIVTVEVVAILALFIGSLVFFASGQSFEQFKGM